MPIKDATDTIDVNPPIPFNQRENLGLPPLYPAHEPTLLERGEKILSTMYYTADDAADSVIDWVEVPSFSMTLIIALLIVMLVRLKKK